ncbi:VWA domain-containing protein [bacterium]|nr:VWA domain-containing protein [bacterium]
MNIRITLLFGLSLLLVLLGSGPSPGLDTGSDNTIGDTPSHHDQQPPAPPEQESGRATANSNAASDINGPDGVSTPYTLTVQVKMVKLFATVLDEKGKIVKGLDREDFELYEDEVTQTISLFTTYEYTTLGPEIKKYTPLSLAVLLDLSGSMHQARKFDHCLTIVRSLADNLVDTDEMALFTFADMFVRTRVPFTIDKTKILDKLRFCRPAGDTALFQAINFMPNIIGEPHNRQGIILLTDGIDTHSIVSMNQMLHNVRSMQVPIYTIGFAYDLKKAHSLPEDFAQPEILKTIAEETGGHYFELTDTKQLADIITEILNELRYQYLIGYHSNKMNEPGSYHSVRLVPKNPSYSVKTRKGYYVSKTETSSSSLEH